MSAYRKNFGCSNKEVMWDKSWVNFIMDLATIPRTDTKKNAAGKMISPADEEAELRKDFGL